MALNRAARRHLKERVKSMAGQLEHPIPDSVTLKGGPMDGWIVKPGAPALQPDWRRQYIVATAESAYEKMRIDRAEAQAEKPTMPPDYLPAWGKLPAEDREAFIQRTADRLGDGRYELARGGRQAKWRKA